ncbi:hypothetical protein [Streptomyces sp. NPDC059003]|uniref:hypothetical protein n=1 Tax=Streptomyces sp. NPDC059003 TaxID=3346691 RepID=UPI00368248AA
MAIDVMQDEDGAEYTERVPDTEPEAEPSCWAHHSNACGCSEEEQERLIRPVAGERYSTEPPFPPGGRRSPCDLDLEPSTW